jgi:hypothetical protein
VNPLHAVISRPWWAGRSSRSISTIFSVDGAASLTNSGSPSRENADAVEDNASAMRLIPICLGEQP